MTPQQEDDRQFFFTYYYVTEEFGPIEPQLYVVLEHYRSNTDCYYDAGTIQGMARLGWREGSNWFWDAVKEGFIEETHLVMPEEADKIAKDMGLDIRDAQKMHINDFIEERGYPPTMLPTDPNYAERIREAKAREEMYND